MKRLKLRNGNQSCGALQGSNCSLVHVIRKCRWATVVPLIQLCVRRSVRRPQASCGAHRHRRRHRWNAPTANSDNGSSTAKTASTPSTHAPFHPLHIHSLTSELRFGLRLTRTISTAAQSIRDVRLQIQRVSSDRDDHVHKASSALEWIAQNRIRRAELAGGSERLEDVKEALARLRRENEKGMCLSLSFVLFYGVFFFFVNVCV